MSHGQEAWTMDTPVDAPKTHPLHKPAPPGPHQPINTHLYNTNLADSVGPTQHTLENFVWNTSVPTVTSMRPNTYPTIANDNQNTPNTYHQSKGNLGSQLHLIGNTRAIMKSKAIKMETLTGKINCLTHTALKTKIYP